MTRFRLALLLALFAVLPSIALVQAAGDPYSTSANAISRVPAAGTAGTQTQSGTKPSTWGFGTQYKVEGLLTVHEEAITLSTADGRSFVLIMSGREAAKYHDRQVVIEGLTHQADDLACLKVKKISPIPTPDPKTVPAPFKQLQTPPSLIEKTSDTFVVKNVRWGRAPESAGQRGTPYRFANTTIRPDLVENVYFIKKPFPPEWIAAHSLFLFTFKPGGIVNDKGEEANGLVLTIEAYQRTDQSYSLVKGMKKQFGVTWILATWQDYLEQSCRYASEKLIPYRAILTQEQKERLVSETITLSVINRSGEYYHTITNNCTNNLVLLFNRVVEKNRQVKLWKIPSLVYNFRATMPVMVPGLLMKKKLLEKPMPEINHTNWQEQLNLED